MRHGYLLAAFILLVLALLAALLWLSVSHAFATPSSTKEPRVCLPPTVSAIIVWRGTADGVPLYHAERLWPALRRLHGPSFWVKTADYGYFDWPSDWAVEAKFMLVPGRQSFWLVSAPSKPGVVFVLHFPNDATYALPDGSHYGIHPTCGAFTVSRAEAERVYALLRR